MTTVLLTGATGVLGQELQSRLYDDGHEIRAASRSPRTGDDDKIEWVELDLTDGSGMGEAITGVDIVVHAASAARGDSEAVDVRGTERLLNTAAGADIQNFVYVSIVGIDEIPYTYYKHKLTAEQAIESSSVPSTIVRVTQFYPFVASLLGTLRWLPIWPLPTEFTLQPIETGEAAQAVSEYATVEAVGRVPDVGGPDVLSARELAEAYRKERGLRRPIIRLPIPGDVASAFRAGKATCPDHTVGTITWKQWLAAQEGVPGKGAY